MSSPRIATAILLLSALAAPALGVPQAGPGPGPASTPPAASPAGRPQAASPASSPGSNPEGARVYASAEGEFVDFDALVARLAEDADVVLVGEQHDDPATHRLELALLEALGRARPRLALSLEMFERDVQADLDAYLAGSLAEDAFLGRSRPWPNYRSDYRPLVEFARAHKLPVIAANVPRRIAAKAASGAGLREIAALPPGDAAFAARDLNAPRDGYWWRFRETMREHMGADGKLRAFYEAQCVKDETMAESIARALTSASGAPATESAAGGGRPLVVHYNGAFHSDFGLGTAERVRRRAPAASVVVVSVVPVADVAAADGAPEAGRGDFVIFCPAPKPAPPAAKP